MFDKIKENICFADIVLCVSLFFSGGFNEYVSCLLTCAISIYFLIKVLRKKELEICSNIQSLAIVILCLFYGISCIWAIDSGMAFVGFLKFLPVLLYMILLWQEDRASSILNMLPYVASVLVVLSVIGAQIPSLENDFLVAGRLAGFFQYPNTFALFLLICELLILQKTNRKVIDYVAIGVLLGGILYTGSRTVFVLLLISNFVMLLLIANKKMRVRIFLISVVAIILIVVGLFIFKDHEIISRYLNIGLGESTFVGRILYMVDALPLLLKYPFGMGYMGYYYIQNSIQTGIYSVASIHNDFLQVFLDIGWIPGLMFLGAMISFFFKKQVSAPKKLIVGTFCLHMLFDFDLQFVSMFFLLMILINTEEKRKTIKIKKWMHILAIGVLIINVYMALSLALAHFGQCKVAHTLYPFDTRNNITMLEMETDLAQANKIADHIIKQNQTYFAPYSVKAKYAYSVGDFTEVIKNKNEVFLRNPFEYTEIEEYCVMLINAVAIFNRQGDSESVAICNQQILAASELLENNRARLSKLGSMIKDQPTLEFSDDILEYMNQLKEAAKK